MKYIQHNFYGRTNIDHAPIARKDSESSEIISVDEGNFSESKEDVVLSDNALSTDSSSSNNNDGYDEENEHAI